MSAALRFAGEALDAPILGVLLCGSCSKAEPAALNVFICFLRLPNDFFMAFRITSTWDFSPQAITAESAPGMVNCAAVEILSDFSDLERPAGFELPDLR